MAIGVAPSRFTHELIVQSGEFVLAWPGPELAEQTLLFGTRSGRDFDKFASTGVRSTKAELVGAPLIPECIANLECRLIGRMDTGDHTIFAGEVLKVWMREGGGQVQCITDGSSGYDILMEHPAWTIGAVKE